MPTRLVGGPRGFRELLERLGPTFIKVGQYLALRPDLIPREFCNELMLLQDHAPPFAWSEAQAILAADLGQDPNQVFAHIDVRPVAAGSLAQTYLARLDDGTRVAVKVQRPAVRTQVVRDLRRARTMARILDLSGASLVSDPRQVVAEIESWLVQELDFRRELANLDRMRALVASSRIARVPVAYPDLCGTRVLTSEYLEGIPVSELLLTLRSEVVDERARADRLGLDRDRLATNLITSTLRQIFTYQFFHADIHPGNLIALPDAVVGYVDFGLCAELDEVVRQRQLRYLAASYSGQPEQIFRALLDVLIVSDQTDVEAFHRDFIAETRAWQSRAPDRTDGLLAAAPSDQVSATRTSAQQRSSIATYLVGIMRVAQRNHVQVPAGLLAMYRTLITADAIAHQLGSDADLSTVGRPFFERLRTTEAMRTLDPERLQATLLSLSELLRESPGQVRQILTDLAEGSLTVNVSSTAAPSAARAHNDRARLIVSAIVTVSVSLLLTLPDLATSPLIPLRWLLIVILAGLYGWIVWQWRRLR